MTPTLIMGGSVNLEGRYAGIAAFCRWSGEERFALVDSIGVPIEHRGVPRSWVGNPCHDHRGVPRTWARRPCYGIEQQLGCAYNSATWVSWLGKLRRRMRARFFI